MNQRSIKNHITEGCTIYIPVYPEKYKGNDKRIIARSSWESSFCKWVDHSKGIRYWASEEIRIRYQDPIQPIKNNKPHFKIYWPDYVIETISGKIYLIEIKPLKYTRPPIQNKNKSHKTMLTENKSWLVNQAKWKAARAYCFNKGWTFKIITEKELFGK